MVEQALDRPIQHIGGDLKPEIAGGAAVAGEYTGDLEADLLDDLDVMPETEGDGFERGAPDMR